MAKPFPDCTLCEGTGKAVKRTPRGFITVNPGDSCPQCADRHKAAAGRDKPAVSYVRSVDDNDVLKRLARLEAAVFFKNL